MSLRLCTLAAALSLGLTAHAGPPPGSTSPVPQPNGPGPISFMAYMSVESCVDNGPCSGEASSSAGPITVQLDPDPQSPFHYSGHYITLDTSSPMRFIGIVTVDVWNVVPGTGNNGTTGTTAPASAPYSLTVEILGDSGVIAKMISVVNSPDQVPSATLVSTPKVVNGTSLTAQFTIMPVQVSSTTRPPSQGPQWKVEQGSLQ